MNLNLRCLVQRLEWSEQLGTMRGDLFARAARIEEHVGTAEHAGVANGAWRRDKMGEFESMELEITKLAKGLQDFGHYKPCSHGQTTSRQPAPRWPIKLK